MSAPATPPKAVFAEVRVLEIRRQVAGAIHSPLVFVPDMYSTTSRPSVPVKPEILDLAPSDLQVFAQAVMAPATAPNAKLLAAMQQAKEWFG